MKSVFIIYMNTDFLIFSILYIRTLISFRTCKPISEPIIYNKNKKISTVIQNAVKNLSLIIFLFIIYRINYSFCPPELVSGSQYLYSSLPFSPNSPPQTTKTPPKPQLSKLFFKKYFVLVQ
ncbi:hypothetical protein SAMN05421738_1111 [Algoriella xinjiangensis]|uniref:Uncharacterized protein n=1 Tax=Algoriella xinjiangensis TaxID=684065 RepID=A0A1I4YEK7_9FLAO|nr:hypothetical protein SAMN05421738_1111 [Algoriella xinjiangensis]VDH17285.1 Uncharacterised protein [Algoriella xinjiangensis]